MSMPAARSRKKLITAEELEHMSFPDKRVELVRGHLVIREPPSTRHGTVAAKLAYFIGAFVYPRRLGVVVVEGGYKLASKPDTVRGPDVSFIKQERVDRVPPRGFADLAPDLAAEIVSPDQTAAEVLAKVADYFAAGATLVWVIDPWRVRAQLYRNDGTVALVDANGALDGENVLPGFTCPLADVLT